MTQTRSRSFVERLANQVSGLVIASLTWRVIAPLFEIEHDWGRNIRITLIFATISIIRGYVVRRLFNWLDSRRKKVCLIDGDIYYIDGEPYLVKFGSETVRSIYGTDRKNN